MQRENVVHRLLIPDRIHVGPIPQQRLMNKTRVDPDVAIRNLCSFFQILVHEFCAAHEGVHNTSDDFRITSLIGNGGGQRDVQGRPAIYRQFV